MVEVTNRFKGLDLIDRVPEELWTEVHDIVQEAGSRPVPRNRNAKRLSDEALQIAEKTEVKAKREKAKREKERYIHLNAEFQRIARRDKKASSVINAKKQSQTIEWERLEISSRKLEIPREHFMQR